jgi:lactoylglutathione lyase
MKLGYTIAYVDDVPRTLDFYAAAFGLDTYFLDDSKMYSALNTGATKLAFCHHSLAKEGVPGGYLPISRDSMPHGIEVGFVTPDVPAAYEHALASGAVSVAAPQDKPWGQTVAYVRDCNGLLVELCTPME